MFAALSSCLNEDDVKKPKVRSMKFYLINSNKEFLEQTELQKGVTYTIGVRNTIKKVGPDVDSPTINKWQCLLQ